MSGSLSTTRRAAIAVRLEATPGVDVIAGAPVAADAIAGDFNIRLNPDAIPDPALTGSLSTIVDTVGGLRPTLEITVPLRGSGAGATPPSWSRLMQVCAFDEVVTAAGIAAVASTAGTATTATLAAGYAATAQIYRGMPLILAGNPAAPTVQPVVDYTAGRVATFNRAFTPILSTATTAQFPPNVLWRPTSDSASLARAVTIYLYVGDFLYPFTAGRGSVRFDFQAGGSGTATFSIFAQYGTPSATAIPAALISQPAVGLPRWVDGHARLLQGLMRCRSLTVDNGIQAEFPPNPEAPQGFDPAVHIARTARWSANPIIDTTQQLGLLNAFTNGTEGALTAVLGAAAGNRFALTLPGVRQLQNDPGAEGGFRANQISGGTTRADADVFLCQF